MLSKCRTVMITCTWEVLAAPTCITTARGSTYTSMSASLRLPSPGLIGAPVETMAQFSPCQYSSFSPDELVSDMALHVLPGHQNLVHYPVLYRV